MKWKGVLNPCCVTLRRSSDFSESVSSFTVKTLNNLLTMRTTIFSNGRNHPTSGQAASMARWGMAESGPGKA